MNMIKLLRKEKGLSQAQLAKLLKVTQTSVSHWENGRTFPDMKQTLALAELFETTTDNILGHATTQTPATTEAYVQDIIKLYDMASPEIKKAALAVLKSAVQDKETQDSPKEV